jgi:transcriptional regulator with XRE-family HTH domain
MGDREPDETADQRLGANLRILRERRGISQDKLASEMAERGHPWLQSTVYRVEHGRQVVKFREAEDLAKILRTSLDRLTWSTPEATATEMLNATRARLMKAHEGVAAAVERLCLEERITGRMLGRFADSEYRRVQDAREDLAHQLGELTLESAVDEGVRRYEERTSEESDDAAEDAEGQPGIVDQQRA